MHTFGWKLLVVISFAKTSPCTVTHPKYMNGPHVDTCHLSEPLMVITFNYLNPITTMVGKKLISNPCTVMHQRSTNGPHVNTCHLSEPLMVTSNPHFFHPHHE